MTQSLFFYHSLKRFYDETKDTKETEFFLKTFKDMIEEEWATIQEVEAMYLSAEKYSMFEAQMSCIMYPWIQYMCKKFHELMRKGFVQILIYCEQPKVATTYSKSSCLGVFSVSVNVLKSQRSAKCVS